MPILDEDLMLDTLFGNEEATIAAEIDETEIEAIAIEEVASNIDLRKTSDRIPVKDEKLKDEELNEILVKALKMEEAASKPVMTTVLEDVMLRNVHEAQEKKENTSKTPESNLDAVLQQSLAIQSEMQPASSQPILRNVPCACFFQPKPQALTAKPQMLTANPSWTSIPFPTILLRHMMFGVAALGVLLIWIAEHFLKPEDNPEEKSKNETKSNLTP